MKFFFESTNNYLLNTTEVSNIFIKLYMPQMNAKHVKVYLYALMHVDQKIDDALSSAGIAEALSITIEDVEETWEYLESMNLVKINNRQKARKDAFDIIFLDLRARTFDPENIDEDNSRTALLDEKEIKDMYGRIESVLAKPLSAVELKLIDSFLEIYKLEPSAIAYVYEYNSRRGMPTNTRYIESILRGSAEAGLRTQKDIVEYNKRFDKREMTYRDIMQALGLQFEIITQAEKREFSRWLDEYDMSLADILAKAELAAGKRNKFSYVKKIIDKEYLGADDLTGESDALSVGKNVKIRKNLATRKKYYEEQRQNSENSAKERLAEAYAKISELLDIDKAIRSLRMDISLANSNKSSLAKRTDLTKELEELETRRAGLLTAAGLSPDYTDIKYNCDKCRDTGVLDSGASCSCY